MKIEFKRELPIFLTLLFPFIYLKHTWNSLPLKVPIHWNINGEADRWTTKTGLLVTISVLLFSSYLFWLGLQKFTKQHWIQQLGGKFYSLRFVFSIFLCAVCSYIVHSAVKQATSLNFVMFIIGALFVIVGNTISSLKPNYFLGIRTPWTLKDELVWKTTHQFSSRFILICGLLMVAISLFQKQNNLILFLILVFIMTIVPLLFSFFTYRQLRKK